MNEWVSCVWVTDGVWRVSRLDYIVVSSVFSADLTSACEIRHGNQLRRRREQRNNKQEEKRKKKKGKCKKQWRNKLIPIVLCWCLCLLCILVYSLFVLFLHLISAVDTALGRIFRTVPDTWLRHLARILPVWSLPPVCKFWPPRAAHPDSWVEWMRRCSRTRRRWTREDKNSSPVSRHMYTWCILSARRFLCSWRPLAAPTRTRG